MVKRIIKKYAVSILLVIVTGAMAVAFTVANAPAQEYPAGMVSYWKFDEGSGTKAYDSVGDNDGTLVNGPVWISGQVRGALSFDGVDDYVTVPETPSIDFQNENSFSISFWMKTSSSNPDNMHLLAKHKSGYWNGYMFFINNHDPGYCTSAGHITFYVAAGAMADACSDSPVNDEQWHFITGVYNSITNEVFLYVDGVVQADVGTRNGNLDNAENLTIGGLPGWTSFNGLIDEVAIYNRTLSAKEIQQHYQNGLQGLGYEEIPPPPDKCEQDLALAVEEIQNLQNQVNNLTQQNQALQNQVNQLQSQVSTLTQQNETLQSQVNTLSAENAQLRSQVSTLTEQNTQLQIQISTLTQQNQALQSQVNQLTTGLVSGLTKLQNDFRVVFNDPTFVIPGATPLEQYQNLINAILNLNKGRKEGIYTNLGGKPGKGPK